MPCIDFEGFDTAVLVTVKNIGHSKEITAKPAPSEQPNGNTRRIGFNQVSRGCVCLIVAKEAAKMEVSYIRAQSAHDYHPFRLVLHHTPSFKERDPLGHPKRTKGHISWCRTRLNE